MSFDFGDATEEQIKRWANIGRWLEQDAPAGIALVKLHPDSEPAEFEIYELDSEDGIDPEDFTWLPVCEGATALEVIESAREAFKDFG